MFLRQLILGFFLLAISESLFGQIQYPFLNAEGDRDIQAYWYNIPQGTVLLEKGSRKDFQSSLHVYGQAPADKFQVKVPAWASASFISIMMGFLIIFKKCLLFDV